MYQYFCNNFVKEEKKKFTSIAKVAKEYGIPISTLTYHFSIKKKTEVVIGTIYIQKKRKET